jgi:hypothetical protein
VSGRLDTVVVCRPAKSQLLFAIARYKARATEDADRCGSTGANANFVAEGQPTPLTALAISSASALDAKKVIAGSVITVELSQSSCRLPAAAMVLDASEIDAVRHLVTATQRQRKVNYERLPAYLEKGCC